MKTYNEFIRQVYDGNIVPFQTLAEAFARATYAGYRFMLHNSDIYYQDTNVGWIQVEGLNLDCFMVSEK